MSKIDIDKFVATLLKYSQRHGDGIWIQDVEIALAAQGLKYEDEEIVENQRQILAEAKEARLPDSPFATFTIEEFDAEIRKAKLQVIDKACEWLELVLIRVKYSKDNMVSSYCDIGRFIKDFEEAMEK